MKTSRPSTAAAIQQVLVQFVMGISISRYQRLAALLLITIYIFVFSTLRKFCFAATRQDVGLTYPIITGRAALETFKVFIDPSQFLCTP